MTTIPLDPRGWWISEKFDGCRCIFDGERFLSRNGRRFQPPPHWFVGMPRCRLDGEVYAGRGGFDTLVSVIQTKGSDWQGITFEVFDLAALRVPFEQRIATLARLPLPDHCHRVTHRPCMGHSDLDEAEADIVSRGGEGCVLREPRSFYRPNGFVKVKRLFPDLNRAHLD